ncbi:LOW QUALITY PROTEIN: protein shisa-5-like [Anoplopoma fimbria]|uniref:LOW QUALITY PROTEIN: protein shisa-5-like n=1 Tax=Anoplopoma fimbria TaxID=229290 RepID=UPI0023EE0793|nr:LOW QUALITY PROTEIN: protein shisa-5-like [Anoplopoma fimbria]
MVPGVLSGLVCVLCLILLPAVWADDCSSFEDRDGYHHKAQQCGNEYCCGNCKNKYCCSERIYHLSQTEQQDCYGKVCSYLRPVFKENRIALLLGSILGTILPIAFCVCLIICCVAPCCLFFKKCRKGRNQHPRATTALVNLPQHPPYQPAGYQPTYPGYQPVPAQPGYGSLPIPTAPPPYMETEDPAHLPVAFPAGVPMGPFPGKPYALPPHPDAPLAYNPAYVPNS